MVNDATSVVLFNAIQKLDLSHINSRAALVFTGNFLYLFLASTFLGVLVSSTLSCFMFYVHWQSFLRLSSRSLGHVSVPDWLIILSIYFLTDELIRHESLFGRLLLFFIRPRGTNSRFTLLLFTIHENRVYYPICMC